MVSLHHVSEIYDYVERMLAEERYVPPPPSLAARHFQRYVVDTANDRTLEIKT